MLLATLQAVRAILTADPSVSTPDRARLMAVLRNGPEPNAAASGKTPSATESRLLRRVEVARRLAVTPRTIDAWTRSGIIHKVRVRGRARAIGFRESEIVALIQEGGAHE